MLKIRVHAIYILPLSISFFLVSTMASPLQCSRSARASITALRCLHTGRPLFATPLPMTATGPPPSAPLPSASQYGEKLDRRRRQAELLKHGQSLRASQEKPGNAMKKRFWKDVSVQTDERMWHFLPTSAVAAYSQSTLVIRSDCAAARLALRTI